ncbi:MAG: HK97-gp10 family putative phage morphogenesis protein [Actinomycetota bacterium]
MSFRYIPNPFLADQVKVDPVLNAELLSRTEKVAEAARTLAPVLTGALRESITAESVGPAEARVVAGVDYAVFVEFGTSVDEAQPFLRPAAAAL